jgi:acyl-CoA reductase-like NAD-dependent aldehyde dehydrogenase
MTTETVAGTSDPEPDETAGERTTEVIESRNPANGELIGTVEVTPPGEVAAAIRRAAAAQRRWAERSIAERAAIVNRAADYVLYNRHDIADLIRKENGKPRTDALAIEVAPTVTGFRWYARHAPKVLADELLPPTFSSLVFGMRQTVRHQPYGVVSVISPWNYPLSIPAGEVGAALVAGNAVVLKPAPLTPLTAEVLGEAFRAAGLDRDLLAIVHGDAPQGEVMCTAPEVGRVIFTGSVETGTIVAREAAEHRKPVTLELGGKDPAIVRADADVDRAVAELLWVGCSNAGQTCVSVERLYVHESIYDRFLHRLVTRAEKLRVGDPDDPSVEVGPMISDEQFHAVKEMVDEAVAAGATLRTGGPLELNGSGRFFGPTILTEVHHGMRVMREEAFGPVLPVMPFRDDDEAVELANDSPFGLGASIWSRDRRRAVQLADRIEAGMVWINEHGYSHGMPQAPWTGMKDSGIGVVHSKYGLLEMTQRKLLTSNYGLAPPAAFPNDEMTEEAVEAFITLFGSRHLTERAAALWNHKRAVAHVLKQRLDARRGAGEW